MEQICAGQFIARGNVHGMNFNTIEEYRANAAKCIGLAQNTPDIQSKLALLEMARGWLLLADQATKNSQTTVVYEPPVPSLDELERRTREEKR
jgi:hypothetical protein